MTLRSRWLLGAAIALGVVLLFVALGLDGRRAQDNDPLVLELEMRASDGTFAQVFWSSDHAFSEARSMALALQPARDAVQRLAFQIPARGAKWLRLDPTNGAGDVEIHRLRLLDAHGDVLKSWDAAGLRPTHEIEAITQEADGIHIVTTAGATDPSMLTSSGCVERPPFPASLSTVTARSVWFGGGLALLFVLASVVAVVASRTRGDISTPRPFVAALWFGALVLIVFSAKLLLMRQYPLTVPFWDQWDAEARVIYLPFADCELTWSQMFDLHNEHRVFFTRLLALWELLANRQWDPRLQQVVNAVVHTLTGAIVIFTLWLATHRRRLELLVLIGTVLFALPLAWENTLQPFQSAFYLLMLFAVLGLWLTTSCRAGSAGWWMGVLCVVCDLFTAAGGVVLPVVVAGVAALGLIDNRNARREWLLAMAVAALVAALGWMAASPPIAAHEPLRAKTIVEFVGAWGRNMAWPFVGAPLMSVIMWTPVAGLIVVVLSRGGRTTHTERYLLGLAAWVTLQSAAVALGRGAGAPPPANRYHDFLSLGAAVNAAVLLVAVDHLPRIDPARRVLGGAAIAWALLTLVGVDRRVETSLAELRDWGRNWSEEAFNVRRFLATGDRETFLSKRLFQLPYPDAASLASVLEEPVIRRILPASVRDPVRVAPGTDSDGAFVFDGIYPFAPRDPLARVWGSFSGDGDPALGRFESQLMPACTLGAHLMFQVSGAVGEPGISLSLRDAQSGRVRTLRPRRMAGTDWESALVRCPDGPYTIVATDERPDRWLAFREPIEMGRVSPYAEAAIGAAPLWLVVGITLGLIAARLT